MNPLETIAIISEEHVSPELIEQFVLECRDAGIDPYLETVPAPGAFMAMEDYIPTALAIFIMKPFFESFLKKAGEDAYTLFKKSLTSLVKKAVSIRVKRFASAPEKIDPKYPFSLYVSVYSKSPEGVPLKFLFHTEGNEEYFKEATDTLCDMIRNENFPKTEKRPFGGTYILCYNPELKNWEYKRLKSTKS